MNSFLKIALAIAALTTFVWTHYRFIHDDSFRDFGIYRMSSEYVRDRTYQNLYDYNKDGSAVFRYPPIYVPFLHLISIPPLKVARSLWHLFQSIVFVLVFVLLYRLAGPLGLDPLKGVAVLFVFSLRFMIDNLFNGQIEGILLLGYTLCLSSLIQNKPTTASAALFFPTSLKIAPGLLYFFLFTRISIAKSKLVRAPLLVFLALEGLLITFLILRPSSSDMTVFDTHATLWKNWIGVLLGDSSYFDGANYKNQSLLGTLLRLDFIPRDASHAIHQTALVLGCALLVGFWILVSRRRSPQTPRETLHLFSLGVLAHLIFMPETMRYTIVHAVIPALVLVCYPPKGWEWGLVAFICVVLPFGGSSILGLEAFMWIQNHSFGFLGILGLTFLVLRRWVRPGPLRQAF